MSTPHLSEVEAFLYAEARALDDRDWETWLTFYAPDASFWMPAWDDNDALVEDPQAEISLIYYARRSGLEDRVFRIKTERSSASTPAPRTNADAVVISAHAPTTCGVLTELDRQNFRPKLLVGLTSASTPETLQLCGAAAEGLLIPTSFIATTPETTQEADEVAWHGGIADLHSMAAWEILYTVKQVQQGVSARPENVAADRRKLRDGLARLTTMRGALGTITRTPDRESLKPFVLVQARQARWQPVFTPAPEHDGN
jgi:hypothetical protein